MEMTQSRFKKNILQHSHIAQNTGNEGHEGEFKIQYISIITCLIYFMLMPAVSILLCIVYLIFFLMNSSPVPTGSSGEMKPSTLTQVLYLSTNSLTLYFLSTKSQREILHFSHHYISLTALVPSYCRLQCFIPFLSSENHVSPPFLIKCSRSPLDQLKKHRHEAENRLFLIYKVFTGQPGYKHVLIL